MVVMFAFRSGLCISGTTGLEHREGMCRLEFSGVCGHGGGEGGECGSRVPYTTQAQVYGLYAEIAHHDCPLLCVATMCSDDLSAVATF